MRAFAALITLLGCSSRLRSADAFVQGQSEATPVSVPRPTAAKATTPLASVQISNSRLRSSAAPSANDGSTSKIGSLQYLWHKRRRKEMLSKYRSQIAPLEKSAYSQSIALPLLVAGNLSLLAMSVVSGLYLSARQTFLLAAFPGSILSLWQLQILHDALHGCFFAKGKPKVFGMSKSRLQDAVLFWGSMPSIFGYYLYLKYGHLTHHTSVGDPHKASLAQLFNSSSVDFEDGDVLFVAHRMKLKGDIGPQLQVLGRRVKMSISRSGFSSWITGNAAWNALMFSTSFLFERCMLMINDVVVAVTGRNSFFPNKPDEFHQQCAAYCRWAVLLRGMLLKFAGWRSLLFLYLSETLWSIPPHPACAMFVTNHGSDVDETDGSCVPSRSTYAGRWYSVLTLGTNYHCEHHDFPTIPLHKLGELRRIAPEYYRQSGNDGQKKDNVFAIMRKAFAKPDFYACMNNQDQIRT